MIVYMIRNKETGQYLSGEEGTKQWDNEGRIYHSRKTASSSIAHSYMWNRETRTMVPREELKRLCEIIPFKLVEINSLQEKLM